LAEADAGIADDDGLGDERKQDAGARVVADRGVGAANLASVQREQTLALPGTASACRRARSLSSEVEVEPNEDAAGGAHGQNGDADRT
jgi:hypothetical protein